MRARERARQEITRPQEYMDGEYKIEIYHPTYDAWELKGFAYYYEAASYRKALIVERTRAYTRSK